MRRRRWLQAAAGLVSALLLVAFGLSSAFANHCSGCIDDKDIARNSVGKPEMKNGAVGTAELINGGVKAADLGKSAKSAVGIVTLAGSTSSATPDTLDTFTITVPAAGYLYVHVSGNFYFDLDAGADETLTDSGDLGLCTAPNSLTQADCGGGRSLITDGFRIWYQDAEDATPNGNNHTPYFSLTRVIKVAGAGPKTLYLNGSTSSATLSLWSDDRAAVLFVPGKLTITS